MSLNWKELGLIAEELDFTGSRLQTVIQHDFHSLSWLFHSSSKGKWTVYTEIGTQYSRIHESKQKLDPSQFGKTKKLQRFVQYCRANIEGGKIIDKRTIFGDRILILTLQKEDRIFNIVFRLYSGPGANIIITDENFVILDLLFRRPKRGENSGEILADFEEKIDNGKFQIRERTPGLSFNEQIEIEYGKQSTDYTLDQLISKIDAIKSKNLKKYEGTATALLKKLKSTENYEENKLIGELLASNIYLVKPHMKSIIVDDWNTGAKIEISLNDKINASSNVEAYFEKYQRAKKTYHNAVENYEIAVKTFEDARDYYTNLLTLSDNEAKDIRVLKKALEKESTVQKVEKITVGLTFISNKFTILVGRNAKENDQLLRHFVRGNDWWMHTRDYPGGYVFIKNQKTKTVPLEVILDAANLAIIYSKAKNGKVADLYYTQVKYLRRAKNGPLGLVIPTMEKNLHVELDDLRLKKLFNEK